MDIKFYKVDEKLPEINEKFQWYRQYLCIASNGNKCICRFEPWSWAKQTKDNECLLKTILDSENNLLVKEKPEGDGWELRYCFREVNTEYCRDDIVYWADIHDLGA